MKMYLFLAILVYKCSNYFSCAEYDLVDGNPSDNEPSITFGYDPDDGGDYSDKTKALVYEFRRSIKSDNTEIEARRRSAIDKNFMRFGRADPTLQRASLPNKRANLMRFGRADRGFLRFGRLPNEIPYSLVNYDLDSQEIKDNPNDVSEDTLPSKRTPNSSEEMEINESGEQSKPKQVMYYRRDFPKNLMRFGKRGDEGKFTRLDRANLMRFGRAGNGASHANYMRFGRASGNMMRFGRSKGNLMRFGRSDPHFLRLIKMDNNFMRFGRSDKIMATKNSNGTVVADLASITAEEGRRDGMQDSQLQRLTNDKSDESFKPPSNSNEDYQIHLREEDFLAPIYVANT
ncbi:FMRFamide-related peptides isoform X2 [Topomyia yanbarensis]|nr:FMRFamide-related peptides isoform X2 [Topomyia yanbarensis]XP_058829740.1 FMRFamide-related peptides isoform X2 [Topomyia yanbarensis]XP_058829741.1 FMRFamide-related peptides isoform X2 [Topomyia yanbarensis]